MTRRRVPAVILLALLAVAVVAGALASIHAFRAAADDARAQQFLSAELEAASYRLSSLEWRAISCASGRSMTR